MARRLVSVELILQAQGYLRESRAVLTTTTATTRAVDDLGDKADAASRDMDQLAANTAVAKRQVNDLGDKARVTAADLALLQRRIDAARLSTRGLALEFARTGDAAVGAQLGRERAALARLERAQKLLTPKDEGGLGLLGAIPRIGGVPGPVIGAGVGLGALLAPAIGAAVGGAVLGGVGTGGLIGGIAAASRDPGVRDAAGQFGRSISAEFFGSGAAFAEPVKKSLFTLSKGFAELNLGDSFAKMAPSVEKVADALVGFAKNAMPGFNKALDAAGPIMDVFADELPQIGDAVSDMLTDISASKGVIGGFHLMLDTVEAVARGLGDTIGWLGDRFEDMVRFQAATTGALEDVFGWVPWVGDHIRDANDHAEDWISSMDHAAGPTDALSQRVREQAGALSATTEEMRRQIRALEDYTGTVLGTLDAEEHWHRSLLDLNDAVKDNGTSLSLSTREGLANRDALEEGARATHEMYAAGLLTDKAYQAQIRSLIDMAVKLGFNRQQVEALIGALAKTPKQVVVDVAVKLGGAAAAIRELMSFGGPGLSGAQRGRGGTDYSTVPVQGTTSRQAFLGYAHGGDVMAGRPVIVGDAGRSEVFAPWANGTIYPSVASYQSAAGGERTIRLIVQDTTGRTLRNTLISDAQSRGVSDTTIEAVYP